MLTRCLVLVLTASSLLLSAGTNSAHAAGAYPNRAIRVIVGNVPGGGGDLIARGMAPPLAEHWSVPVVVDNRAGASGAIALELTAKATPDGYTLYVGGNQLITAGVQKLVRFDVRSAFTPIAQLTLQPYLLLVVPSLNVTSVKELIAVAKSKPGQLSYASSGYGTATHLSTEFLKSVVGIDVIHVPYKGIGQALIDMLGGRIHFAFVSTVSAAPHLKSGRLRAIAVSSARRAEAFPKLPTVADSGVPNFDLTNGFSLYGPANLPPAVTAMLNREATRAMNTPEMKARLAAEGTQAAAPQSPEQFRKTFIAEVTKWETFVRKSGIRVSE